MAIFTTALTVRFLVAGTGTRTTELLGLHAAGVSNEKGTVVGYKTALELVLGVLIDVLLVVGDQTLGNGLADSIELRNVTTTGDADADVEVGVVLRAQNKDGLENLETEDLRLDEGDGDTVKFEQTFTLVDVGNSSGSLLLAESLDAGNSGSLLLRHCV